MTYVYASEAETAEVAVEGHTTVASPNESVAASLGLNGQLFIFQLINFAIVAAIVWFLILKPLSKKLEERKKIIDNSLDKAKEIDSNLQMAEQKFQAGRLKIQFGQGRVENLYHYRFKDAAICRRSRCGTFGQRAAKGLFSGFERQAQYAFFQQCKQEDGRYADVSGFALE